MRAITCAEYGPPEVLQLTEVAKPTPKDDEVLIRVRAASVNPLDWHFMRGSPQLLRLSAGWNRPKNTFLGVDLAGLVESAGRNVTQFQPGDEVFGACRGSFADYVCVRPNALARKPANLTFEQAAAVTVAGLSALQGLRDKGRMQSGQKVLINGASGGVGTFAVQIARLFGAEVTGVCSTRNVDLVRSLGAGHVVDHTREDFTRNGQRYDLILDTVGNHPFAALRRALTPKGTLVLVGGPVGGRWLGPFAGVLKAIVSSWFASQKACFFLMRLGPEDLKFMQELLGAGTVSPVIDRSYPLSEVPAAIRYVEEGHARGKVVITLGT